MPIAKLNGIEIWYETFGDRSNPALLLVMGGCCQGILWPTEFCQQLSKAGFFVIRYDHRDTGLSSYFDYKKTPYDLNDMAKDAMDLLNYLDIPRCHVLGLSLGGPIAESLAVSHPSRILSITIIASSGNFRPMNLAYAGLPIEMDPLPPPKLAYLRWMKEFTLKKEINLHEHIKLRVAGWKLLSGNKVPFEEERYSELQKEFIERQRNPESIINHIHVCRDSETIINALPSKVRVPTLVIHGSEDPIFPQNHGRALSQRIKNSEYVLVDGLGHVPNRHFYRLIINRLKGFTGSR